MLSKSAQEIIQNYLSLPFSNQPGVRCPYFNNRTAKIRGGLNAHIGKGTPADIVEEAIIFALKEKLDLKNFSSGELTKFLVDHRLGVDCSGFVYHVLNAQSKACGLGSLKKNLKFPFAKNIWRRLLCMLRPMAHAGVSTFAHEHNSKTVDASEIKPGDMIILLNADEKHDHNHMLIVTETEKTTNNETKIKYVHSIQYKNDSRYEHGVREGEIIITDSNKNLLEQKFIEEGKENAQNKLFQYAQTAQKIEIKRLNKF